MFNLPIDLSDLEQRSDELMTAMDSKLAELEKEMPQLHVRKYLEKVGRDFEETPFMPLDDMWERELGDIL
jgi:hypothetical protein